MADDKLKKNADLPVRVASAVVMVLVAGTALWLGGWVWTLFVAAIGLGVVWEWWSLVRGFVSGTLARLIWLAGGVGYVGLAVVMLMALRGSPGDGWQLLMLVLLAVIGTDVGAYFSGRTFGGPKIAPKISPSKTWAGLVGGAFGAAAMVLLTNWSWHAGLCETLIQPSAFGFDGPCSFSLAPLPYLLGTSAAAGTMIAAIAQTGDFFESWMKRCAGVKDSGKLIPGHGGLFDRTDGLIAVLAAIGLYSVASFLIGL